MNSLVQKLLLCGSTLSLAAMMPCGAFAQTAAGASGQSDSQSIEQVVVSASRISIAGYSAPTPVSVVSAAQLQSNAYGSVIDTLNSVPQLMTNFSNLSATLNNTANGNFGSDEINMRGLGNYRTLVLLDDQRYVMTGMSNVDGYDLSIVPMSMISRVDIVTGGASAAWGSDAIAGVINLVLNKNVDGFHATVEGGDAANGLVHNLILQGDWGGDVFDGRGHIEFAATANIAPDWAELTQMNWYRGAAWVSNPAYAAGNGQPQLIVANNVGNAQSTQGGLIISSPKGTGATPSAANALRGIEFVGAGNVQQANFGSLTLGVFSVGGSLGNPDFLTPVAIPRSDYTFFGYGRYKLTDSIQASLQTNYGYATGEASIGGSASSTTLVIKSDNAYIPASVRAAMQAGGITSFTLGTTGTNNLSLQAAANGQPLSLQAQTALGVNIEYNHHTFARAVFGLDGELGDDWSWKFDAESSETRYNALDRTAIAANVAAAEDAVTVTAANVGNSGLAIGSIACRQTLTGTQALNTTASTPLYAMPGCVPMDVFGNGVLSQAAYSYISGNGQYPDTDHAKNEQDVVEASMQGVLPWGLPAGRLAVAFGASYRHEMGYVQGNPMGPVSGYTGVDFPIYPGNVGYAVTEGFAEVDAPILKNNIVESVDFNMAGRITDYSTSGLVETWKLGATSQIDDNIKLRTTYSVDIRAPDLYELFNPGTPGAYTLTDPKTQITASVPGATNGNRNLVPEIGRNVSGGVVLTPTFIPGLHMSADWFSVNITGEITSIAPTAIAAQCNPTIPSVLHVGQNGNINDPLCTLLVFNGPNGALSYVNIRALNIASLRTSGLDLAADYSMDFWDGTLSFADSTGLTDEYTFNQPATAINDLAGSENFNGTMNFAPGPKWKGTFSATYDTGPYSLTTEIHWLGTAKYTNLANTGNLSSAAVANLYDPAHFEVPAIAYLNLRGSYKWNDNISLFGAIDNTFDTPPPLTPRTTVGTGLFAYDANPSLYPLLGRSYRFGIRFNY